MVCTRPRAHREQLAVRVALLAEQEALEVAQPERELRLLVDEQLAEDDQPRLARAGAELVVELRERERLPVGVVDPPGEHVAAGRLHREPHVERERACDHRVADLSGELGRRRRGVEQIEERGPLGAAGAGGDVDPERARGPEEAVAGGREARGEGEVRGRRVAVAAVVVEDHRHRSERGRALDVRRLVGGAGAELAALRVPAAILAAHREGDHLVAGEKHPVLAEHEQERRVVVRVSRARARRGSSAPARRAPSGPAARGRGATPEGTGSPSGTRRGCARRARAAPGRVSAASDAEAGCDVRAGRPGGRRGGRAVGRARTGSGACASGGAKRSFGSTASASPRSENQARPSASTAPSPRRSSPRRTGRVIAYFA